MTQQQIEVKDTDERVEPMHVPLDRMWNAGELQIQELLGKRERVDRLYGKTVFSEIPDMNVWRFLEQRHVVYVAAMDPSTGEVWSSPVFANPRFEGADEGDHRSTRGKQSQHCCYCYYCCWFKFPLTEGAGHDCRQCLSRCIR